VFVDHGDPSIFYLVTRWTDLASFETWHGSAAHRESHALIPKGLKLDPAWTQVLHLLRLEGTTAPALTEALIDSALLTGSYVAASEGVHAFALTAHGTIRACNAAAASIDRDTALEGRSLTEYMPHADAERLRQLLARPHRTQQPVRLNFAGPRTPAFTLDCWLDVHSDGAVLLGHAPARRDQQLQDELMAINQELAVLSRVRSRAVREERVGREEAEQLNRERNAFLTVIAHELRQPISASLAALSVMRRLVTDAKLERPRAVIERQMLQLTRLVDDLADTARVASGAIELRNQEVDLVQQLRQLSTSWEESAKDQDKSFRSDLPPTPVLVRGDLDRLQQIFSNLVSNALKYTPTGKQVVLTLRTDGEFAETSVADEGEGIPADRLPRIFELFQRATTTGTGLGVGLSVVHALVTAHGGTIEAASPGVGLGATFTVRLPKIRS
jgi:signal transduction histidine kinase